MVLINVSFTEELLKVTASLALRIPNPKVDTSLTSFVLILGILVGVKCPVEFSLMGHNEMIGGLLHCLKKTSALSEHGRSPRN